MAMRITIITPAPKESQVGNRITANRWSGILRALRHRTRILMDYDGRPCDVLVVLHARKGHEALARCRREQPQIPIVLALTGTDLYGDIRTDARAQQSLEWADRLIVLQPLGILELPEHLRTRTRVIHQSVEPLARKLKPRTDAFSICVMGHLREVKDPFRAAEAVREMPTSSHIQITHIGSALSPEMAVRAQNEIRLNARYTWLGDVPRARALRLLACSRLLVLSSLMEGGANVVSEALSFGVPVVSSRISGSIGMLGDDYPGFFPPGDTMALRALLLRCEQEPAFLRQLQKRCRQVRGITSPAREKRSWKVLLGEIFPNQKLPR
jgi:putative glycosyltransferase (TIGR04348 family)